MSLPAVDAGVDRDLVHAWLAGRSLARGIAAPVPDRGGYRVDTASAAETSRWVYADADERIAELARCIAGPGYLIKLCGTASQLAALLPGGWHTEATGFFMIGTARCEPSPLPAGYDATLREDGGAAEVTITAPDGTVAARGFAGETPGGFTYDRIVAEPDHRRIGLGRAVMARLAAAKRDPARPDLLVATPMGRLLYEALGWRVLSPYATATPGTPA